MVPNTPYLLIQRNSKIRTTIFAISRPTTKNTLGILRRVEFTLHGLSIELGRPNDNLLSLTFTMAPSDFEEASRVVKIIAGEIGPQ